MSLEFVTLSLGKWSRFIFLIRNIDNSANPRPRHVQCPREDRYMGRKGEYRRTRSRTRILGGGPTAVEIPGIPFSMEFDDFSLSVIPFSCGVSVQVVMRVVRKRS